MPSTSPIINLEYAKEYIEVRTGDATFDSKIDNLIAVATLQIEKHCHRFFTNQEFTEIFNSRNTVGREVDLLGTSDSGFVTTVREQYFSVAGYPLLTTPTVQVFYDPDRVFDASLDELDLPDDFDVDDLRNRIIIQRGTRSFLRSVKIIYTAGYTVNADTIPNLNDTAPDDMRLACAIQTAFLFRKTKGDNIGFTTDRAAGSTEGGNFLTNGGITPEAGSLLRDYRKILSGRR